MGDGSFLGGVVWGWIGLRCGKGVTRSDDGYFGGEVWGSGTGGRWVCELRSGLLWG
jgi:hypothetical protein